MNPRLLLEKFALKFGYPEFILANLAKSHVDRAKLRYVVASRFAQLMVGVLKVGNEPHYVLASKDEMLTETFNDLHGLVRRRLESSLVREVKQCFVGCSDKALVRLNFLIEDYVQKVFPPLPAIQPRCKRNTSKREESVCDWRKDFQHDDQALVKREINSLIDAESARADQEIGREFTSYLLGKAGLRNGRRQA